MRERFTQEEANEILLRAVESQPLGRDVTREQLASVAAEIGISPDTLRLAEEKWLAERGSLVTERRAFEMQQRKSYLARLKLTIHIAAFALLNILFIAINDEAANDPPWSLAILLTWSIFLYFHVRTVRESSEEQQELAFRRWLHARAAGLRPTEDDWAGRPFRPLR